jgi:hypothetical protein
MIMGLGAFAIAQPYNVTFQVDMNTMTAADTISVAGSFQGAAVGQTWTDWTPGETMMTDANTDGIYEVTVQLPADTFGYKFINGTMWGMDEGVPGACAFGGNRQVIVTGDVILPPVCFASCDPCPTTVDTVSVTLMVDMRNETIADTITVAGSFQSAVVGQTWTNWTPGLTILTDPDNDSIYTVTLDIVEGTYEYKYLNGTAWGTDEGIPTACATNNNRELIVAGPGPITVPVNCYAGCGACIPPLPAINVTFRVDMNNEIVNSGGVFVSGNFMVPAWVKDSLEMTVGTSAGVYEFTTSIVPNEYQYKYFNGPGGDDDGETFDFETGGCGAPSGVGGWNRVLNINGRLTDTILPIYVYNTCNTTLAAVGNEFTYDFNVYPNPFTNNTTVDIVRADRKSYNLRIVNITGQVVFEQKNLRTNRVEISRNGLESGMYFIQLENESGAKATRKVVVQ